MPTIKIENGENKLRIIFREELPKGGLVYLGAAADAIAAAMQTGESDEVKWYNAGLTMALNIIADMEAGR